MLRFADTRPAIRQNLAAGRVSERITGHGLSATSATLTVQAEAGPVLRLPAVFLSRAEGYFAFSILPDRDMPAVAAAPSVTLRAEFTLPGRPPLVAVRSVAGTALALADRIVRVAGQDLVQRRIAGAPVDLSASLDPPAVALRGIVLRDHDPGEPVVGARVAAGGLDTLTDAQGRFFLPALPLLAEVALELTVNAVTTSQTLRVDYARPVNSVTLSLPG